MGFYGPRRDREYWTEDERRMQWFFPKLILIAAAGVLFLVAVLAILAKYAA